MKLYTRDGALVADVFVPPFKNPVELLVWGERFFIRQADGRYLEAAGAFYVPPARGENEEDLELCPAARDASKVVRPAGEGNPKATTDGEPPADGNWDAPAPKPIDPATGQHGAYFVMPEEERKKGFVRPVRRSYQHVGIRPQHPTRDLTDEEKEFWEGEGYVKFEVYPEGFRPNTKGRFWKQEELESGCGTVTKMGRSLAETYAREPKYYGQTFCCGCGTHLPVEEFVWDGTDERVGS